MRKILLFLLLSSVGFSQAVRSINGSTLTTQRISIDTSSSNTTWSISTAAGIHTIKIPVSRLANIGIGSVGNADSLGNLPASAWLKWSDTSTVASKAWSNGRFLTSVSGTSPIVSSGGLTPTISFSPPSGSTYDSTRLAYVDKSNTFARTNTADSSWTFTRGLTSNYGITIDSGQTRISSSISVDPALLVIFNRALRGSVSNGIIVWKRINNLPAIPGDGAGFSTWLNNRNGDSIAIFGFSGVMMDSSYGKEYGQAVWRLRRNGGFVASGQVMALLPKGELMLNPDGATLPIPSPSSVLTLQNGNATIPIYAFRFIKMLNYNFQTLFGVDTVGRTTIGYGDSSTTSLLRLNNGKNFANAWTAYNSSNSVIQQLDSNGAFTKNVVAPALGIGTSPAEAITVSAAGTTLSGSYKVLTKFVNSSSGHGIRTGDDGTNGIISGIGTSGLDLWTYNGTAWGSRFLISSAGNVTMGGTISSGSITSSGYIDGGAAITDTSSFSTTDTRKAVYISGATSTDKYAVSIRNAIGDDTLPVEYLSYYAKTDTLVVLRNAGTTSGLKFSYIRIK